METLGARMRAARKAAGLSQFAVATELGVTKGSLSAWENDNNFPQLQTFIALCALYRASADALLFPSTSIAEPRPEYVSAAKATALGLVQTLSDTQCRALLELLGN